jgi:hypothetical protein
LHLSRRRQGVGNEPENIFGELAILKGGTRSAAIVEEPAHCYVLPMLTGQLWDVMKEPRADFPATPSLTNCSAPSCGKI